MICVVFIFTTFSYDNERTIKLIDINITGWSENISIEEEDIFEYSLDEAMLTWKLGSKLMKKIFEGYVEQTGINSEHYYSSIFKLYLYVFNRKKKQKKVLY